MATQTHRLNSPLTALDVTYKALDTKTRFDSISAKTEEVVEQKFHLSDIWINNQPAKYVKGFKAQIMTDTSLMRAEIKAGKLYLFSDSFLSIPITVKYESQTRSFLASPNLKVTGFRALLENEFNCSNYTIYDLETSTPLGEAYTLESCGITENATLEILIDEDPLASADRENTNLASTENGLGMAPLAFNNFSKTEAIPFDSAAPVWRAVEEGLNFEGTCPNEKCDARNKVVCDPKGIGIFSLNEECVKATCPSCHEPIVDVTNCIFWNCVYTIEGVKSDSTETFLLEKQIAPKDKGTSFKDATGEESNVVNWKYLKITTSIISDPSVKRCVLF